MHIARIILHALDTDSISSVELFKSTPTTHKRVSEFQTLLQIVSIVSGFCVSNMKLSPRTDYCLYVII